LGDHTFAVECKGSAKPLSREKVADVWRDYAPVVADTDIDGLLLVTRSGIVAGATSAIRRLPFRHVTVNDLFAEVFPVDALLKHAELAFDNDQLRNYYQPLRVLPVDVKLAAGYPDLYEGWLPREVSAALRPNPRRDDARNIAIANTRARDWAVTRGEPSTVLTVSEAEALVDMARVHRKTAPVSLAKVVYDWIGLSNLPQPTGLALLGSYGTGKSSFARAIADAFARKFRAGTSNRVPILIELRHFGQHQSIEGLISHELSNRHGATNASFDTFQDMNVAGRLLVILDGFDEMKEGMSRDALAYNFSELNRLLTDDSRVILCGRPTIFDSDDEQRAMLANSTLHGGRYIRLTVAPMSLASTRRAIHQYVAARATGPGGDLRTAAREVDHELSRSKQLRDLLSRPVHFPMLLSVLPRSRQKLASISRATLYEAFVSQVIQREMKPGRPPTISLKQREIFARDLAVSMFALGDSRSIRYGLIPDSIVAVHRRGDEPLEAIRRDLVRACFLERKSPDILFFPHKSFAEYLVARRLGDAIGDDESDTDRFKVSMSLEIASFLSELLTETAWTKVVNEPHSHRILIRYFFGRIAETPNTRAATDPIVLLGPLEKILLDPTVIKDIADRQPRELPDAFLHHLAAAYSGLAKRGVSTSETVAFLAFLATLDSDLVAVHAVRGLAKASPDLYEAIKRDDRMRWARWAKNRWV
jgi:hypothetical protein